MKFAITNINPPTNDLPFITLNAHIEDPNTIGQVAMFYLLIEKDDASLSEIESLAKEKLKDFLTAALKEVDNL